jgi:hypothetical protein
VICLQPPETLFRQLFVGTEDKYGDLNQENRSALSHWCMKHILYGTAHATLASSPLSALGPSQAFPAEEVAGPSALLLSRMQ